MDLTQFRFVHKVNKSLLDWNGWKALCFDKLSCAFFSFNEMCRIFRIWHSVIYLISKAVAHYHIHSCWWLRNPGSKLRKWWARASTLSQSSIRVLISGTIAEFEPWCAPKSSPHYDCTLTTRPKPWGLNVVATCTLLLFTTVRVCSYILSTLLCP